MAEQSPSPFNLILAFKGLMQDPLLSEDDDMKECFTQLGKADKRCMVASPFMAPNCNFKCKVVSSCEANISACGKVFNIKADGKYSEIEICLMYGKTSDGGFRSHWGLILKQQKFWYLNGTRRKCLLFHHMGSGQGVEIMVGCINCLRRRVLNVYGKPVKKPKLECFDLGRSSAAVVRFLDEKSLGRNISYEYNSKYTKSKAYYEWNTTNCCRLVMDLLFNLKLDRKYAYQFTGVYAGNEHWDEVYKTIIDKYPEFAQGIFKFWIKIKQNKDLKKIEQLIDGQYKLNEALGKVYADSCCIL